MPTISQSNPMTFSRILAISRVSRLEIFADPSFSISKSLFILRSSSFSDFVRFRNLLPLDFKEKRKQLDQ